MEIPLKNLRKDLKTFHIKYYYQYRQNEEIKAWCFRVIDMMCILKHSLLSKDIRGEINQLYSELLENLKHAVPLDPLKDHLLKTEKKLVEAICTPLKLEDLFEKAYSDALETRNSSHQNFNMFSLTLSYLIFTENDLTLDSLWDEYLINVFKNLLGLKSSQEFLRNHYMSFFKKKIAASQQATTLANSRLAHQDIFEFLDCIFCCSENYRFFWKACKIYSIMSSFQANTQPKLRKTYLKITITQIPNKKVEIQEAPEIRPVNKDEFVQKEFQFNSNNENDLNFKRKDGLILIGKHKCADIQISHDKYVVDDICFAILFKDNDYLMIDCSKYNYSSIKMDVVDNTCYQISNGSLINLANRGIMHISKAKIVVDEQDEELTNRTTKSELPFLALEYQFISGCLALYFGEKRGFSRAYSKKKQDDPEENSIIFGRGGTGFEVDEHCDIQGYTARRHIKFFTNDDGEVVAKDLGSKNGTFLLLKNYNQIMDLKWSVVMPVSVSATPIENYLVTLIICDCTFLIQECIKVSNINIYTNISIK